MAVNYRGRGVCDGGGIRNENGGRGSASLFDSVCYAREDGLAEMLTACLLGICAPDDLGACMPVSMPASPRLRRRRRRRIRRCGRVHTVFNCLLCVEAVAGQPPSLRRPNVVDALTSPACP
jgi:hypothetical protein